MQLLQAHSRTVETTRSISKVTLNFFNTLDTHASKLTCIVDEAQTVNEQKLSDLQRNFEVILSVLFLRVLCVSHIVLSNIFLLHLQECAAKEERELLEKVAELLAASNARKKELVCLNLPFLHCRFTFFIVPLHQFPFTSLGGCLSSLAAELFMSSS